MSDDALHIWTVYERPKDMPAKYVARCFIISANVTQATDQVLVADTLEVLRTLLPLGLTKIPRWPEDEPHIVEVWL